VTAFILAQIPDPDIAASIATNQLALVRVYNHIINRNAMCVIPLDISTPGVPDLDGAVFRTSHEPF
jgi:hypothetical protein